MRFFIASETAGRIVPNGAPAATRVDGVFRRYGRRSTAACVSLLKPRIAMDVVDTEGFMHQRACRSGKIPSGNVGESELESVTEALGDVFGESGTH